jgi:hypothetical protein
MSTRTLFLRYSPHIHRYLSILVYSAAIQNEETLIQCIFYACQTILNHAGTSEKNDTVHDRCVHACIDLGTRTFQAFALNCNLINNENPTVMKLGMCIYAEILYFN